MRACTGHMHAYIACMHLRGCIVQTQVLAHAHRHLKDSGSADIHGFLDMAAEWVRDLAASAALWDDEQLRAELQATTAAWDAWLHIAAHAALCIVDDWYPPSGLAGEALPVGDNASSDHDEADAFDAQSYTSPGEEVLDRPDDEADTLDTLSLSTSPGWTDPQLDGPDLPETQLESDSMQRQAKYRDVKADALDAMSCISSGEAVLDDGLDLPEPEPQPEIDSMQRQATYLDVKADAPDAMSCISPGEQVPDDCHDLPELQPEVNSMQPQTTYLDASVAQSPPTEDRSESKGKTEGIANALQMIIQELREAEAAQTPPRTKRDAAKDGPREPTEAAERPEPPAAPAATLVLMGTLGGDQPEQLAALEAEGDAIQALLDRTRRLRLSAPFAARSPSATSSQRAPLAARLTLQSARRRTLLVATNKRPR